MDARANAVLEKVKPMKSARERLLEAAADCMEKAGGDLPAAARALDDIVWSDRDLRDELVRPLTRDACYDILRKSRHEARRAVWSGVKSHDARAPLPANKRIEALARGTAASLMLFQLQNGKQLGDATRAEVADAAGQYETQAMNLGFKARWLRLIAQSVPDGQTVAEALTDERLIELQAEAANG